MDSGRWKQVDNLLQDALDLPVGERVAYLKGACRGDAELEKEVWFLLQSAEAAGSFLEGPPTQSLERKGELKTGQMVSHFRLLGKLGEGGMGVVYKAEDTRLLRFVALKFLAEHVSRDAKALGRFQREARAASSLNHPHICTIYDVEEFEGQPVIVMELLEGMSLKERVRGGAMSNEELVDFAAQTADALDAAHAKGIVHRDIKTANLFVNSRGQAKILDFGLAKIDPERKLGASTELELSSAGNTMGTLSYMSPEQVRAEELDARSDLFSFGVVMYEMATGKQPFRGDSAGVIFAAILHQTPAPAGRLNPEVPAELERIIGKCLEKDRELRYQSAAEIRTDLKRMQRGSESGQASVAARPPRPWRWIAIGVVAMAALGAAYWRGAPKLTAKDTIILADFTNTTGDPVFDETLQHGLTVELNQSPFLSVISDQKIRATMALMGQAKEARVSGDVAREICERTGSAAVLEGSIRSLGSQYVVALSAKNCRTSEVLDEEQAQAAKREDVLNALSQIAVRFRKKVGESLASVQSYSTPLPEATTTSLEALKAFSLGWKAHHTAGPRNAIAFYKRAIEIDPNFASAHAWLGRVYDTMGETAQSAESFRTAYGLRDRLSSLERFHLSFSYDRNLTGNLEKARDTCELWAQTYPREGLPHGFLAGAIYRAFGKYEKGVEEANKLIELDPENAFGYGNLASNLISLGRLEEAEKALDRGDARKLYLADYVVNRYQIAFLRDDQAAMDRLTAKGAEEPGAEDWISDQEATTLAYVGMMERAAVKYRKAMELAEAKGLHEAAGQHEAGVAAGEGLVGNMEAARAGAAVALGLSRGRDVLFGVAVALSLAGDVEQGRKVVEELEERYAEDTLVKLSFGPTVRALLALKEGNPASAIEVLRPTAVYELGWTGNGSVGFNGTLYPIYVRGLAYLARHQGAEAAAEFQKILDHRGIVINSQIGALARLQKGRALAMSGDRDKARATYQDFLTLWKAADTNIPVLVAAKAEYSKL